MATITAKEVDWKSVATRLSSFRKMLGLSSSELADKLGITEPKLLSYEGGFERKSFGDIIRISEMCKLDIRWLLTGKGRPFKQKNKSYIDPLLVDKGAGKRRSEARKNADEGIMTDEMLEFVLTVDEFKRKNKKSFPSISELYQLMLYMGYRKVEDKAPHFDCLVEL